MWCVYHYSLPHHVAIKDWGRINLGGCYFQDKGLNILYHALCRSTDVTISVPLPKPANLFATLAGGQLSMLFIMQA